MSADHVFIQEHNCGEGGENLSGEEFYRLTLYKRTQQLICQFKAMGVNLRNKSETCSQSLALYLIKCVTQGLLFHFQTSVAWTVNWEQYLLLDKVVGRIGWESRCVRCRRLTNMKRGFPLQCMWSYLWSEGSAQIKPKLLPVLTALAIPTVATPALFSDNVIDYY